MSTSDEETITQSFFDFFDKYMNLQYVVEACAPYFSLPYGKLLVDDLLRIAMEYGMRGELLMDEYAATLTQPEPLNRMADGIGKLSDKIGRLTPSAAMKIHSDIHSKEFHEYVSNVLISPSLDFHRLGFEGREWYVDSHGDITCRTQGTRELNGAHIAWGDDLRPDKVSYFVNDTAVLVIYIDRSGAVEVFKTEAPVEVQIADSEELDDKIVRSEVSWPTVLAGTALGLLVTSLLKPNKTQATMLTKETKTEEIKYGVTKI